MIVKLEIHNAKRTPAKTWWTVKLYGKEILLDEAETLNVIQRIYDTSAPNKTHYEIYYEVINPLIKFIKHRISNRGNYSRIEYDPAELEVKEEVMIL
jgi:hypothetical protein